jgi:flagellar hook assembly protein FlgD
MNYPNPMKEKTTFSFEHNRPNLPLETNLEIYHANSQLVYKTNRILSSKGTRLASIQWDGKDGKGRKLPPGTYFFRIIVVQNSQKQQASGQLIIH